jgi:stage II sporulation protein D
VFGGLDDEKPETNKAVDMTQGEVVTWNGKLANTLFHASCGGHTEVPTNVWPEVKKTAEYLQGVECEYCKTSPHQNWSMEVKEDYLRRKLQAKYPNISQIKNVDWSGKSSSGRAKYVIVKYINTQDEYTEIRVPAGNFRLIVDPWVIKSTLFTDMTKKKTSFVFKGNGWGHAVGLCQWGAKGMAENGFSYKEILMHYYPGTQIEKWNY